MAERVYYGVVQGNCVRLPAGVELRDGLRVEVCLIDPPAAPPAPSDPLQQQLQALGLVRPRPTPAPPAPAADRSPIHVTGSPLSAQIRTERR